jgi:hypothetical protein
MAKLKYGDQNGKDVKPRVDKAPRFNDVKFVQRELSSEETAYLKGTVYSAEDMANHIEKYGEEFVITFKWDSYSQSPACHMRPIAPDHQNTGYILVGRGSSFLKALRQVIYKHEILGKGEAWSQWDKDRSYVIDD